MNALFENGPLFLQVAKRLREEIMGLPVGTKIATDVGLARQFSVSVSVVREALSILTREGWVTRHVGRGTFTASPHVGKPIAILSDLDFGSVSHPQAILLRIQEAVRLIEARGQRVQVYLGNRPWGSEAPESLCSKTFLEDAKTGAFAGVLAVWAAPLENWTRLLQEKNIPLVGIGLLHEKTVSYDLEAYIRLALETLKKRGRRRIAYLGGMSSWNLQGHNEQQKKDVPRWFAEAGVKTHPSWFQHNWHPSQPGASWDSFREIWSSRKEKPDGIIVNPPRLWNDLALALASMNLQIPRDLDVTLSMESAILPHLPPSAAIPIVFDSPRLVHEAIDLLFSLMDGKTDIETRRLVNAWSVQESCVNSTKKSTIDSVSLFSTLFH